MAGDLSFCIVDATTNGGSSGKLSGGPMEPKTNYRDPNPGIGPKYGVHPIGFFSKAYYGIWSPCSIIRPVVEVRYG
jgi:hypothetical protein